MLSNRGCLYGALLVGTLLLAQSAEIRVYFAEAAASSGVKFESQPSKTTRKYLIESMVGGVALFDADGDGWLDIYMVNGAALADPMKTGMLPDKSDPRFWNRLYRNKQDGTFEDITETAGVRGDGYGMGVAAADFDNDGRTDLYVTQIGKNILFRNLGNGRFRDITSEANVGASGWSTGAAFVDYDRDGDLDLFVARYLTWDFSQDIWCGSREPGQRSYCHPNQFKPITHILYRNKGNGGFEDVSSAAGLNSAPGKGLGVAINDYNRDGLPDVLVANDSFPQQLFRNGSDGKLTEVGLESGIAYNEDGETFAGMGLDFADFDRDGWPDVFINALANQQYALFRNQKGNFEYVSGPSGIGKLSKLHSGWGAGFLDFDSDGWRDLFVAQGHVMDNIELTQPSVRYREPLLLMRNNRGRFTDSSAAFGAMAGKDLAARGAAFGDLNNDGAIDVVVNCLGDPARILMGKPHASNGWLSVNAVGTTSNRDAIGASIRVVAESGAEQFGFVNTSSSYLSANDKRVHFGLGPETVVKMLEIRWPSGRTLRLENVKINQVVNAREPAQ